MFSASKSIIKALEENKSKEFSIDALWLLHTGMLNRFTMAFC